MGGVGAGGTKEAVVDAEFVASCVRCDAGYRPCCLEAGFGPVLAAAVAPFGAPASHGQAVQRRRALDLRCRRCVAFGAAATTLPVEAILAHRLRFVRNAALDRLLSGAGGEPAGAAAAGAAGGAAAIPLDGSRKTSDAPSPRRAMVDCSYIPQLQFLVKWRQRGHWHDSWEPAFLLQHIGKHLLASYLRARGLAGAAADLARDLIAGERPPHQRWTATAVVYSNDDPARFAPEATVRSLCRAKHLSVVAARVPWALGGGARADDPLQPSAFGCLAAVPGVGCALPLPRLVTPEEGSCCPASAPPPLEVSLVAQYLDSFESREGGGDDADDDGSSSTSEEDETVSAPLRAAARAAAHAAPEAADAVFTYCTLSAERTFRPEHLVVDLVVSVRRRSEAAAAAPLTPDLIDVLQRLRIRETIATPKPLHERCGLVSAPCREPVSVGRGVLDASVLRYDPSGATLREAVARREAVYGRIEMLVQWKGCTSAEATWEPGALVAAVAPAAVLRFYRTNARCLHRAVEAERDFVRSVELPGPAAAAAPRNPAPASFADASAASAAMDRDGDAAAGFAGASDGSDVCYSTSPAFLPLSLFPYQLEGLNWLLNRNARHIGACLAGELDGRTSSGWRCALPHSTPPQFVQTKWAWGKPSKRSRF